MHISPTIARTRPRLAFDLVRPQIKQVNRIIQAQVEAFDPEIVPHMDYICRTSGKRIRPALAILTGGAILGTPKDEHMKIGVILELIHMATLLHDDVIDKADTRRDRKTPNALWGNRTAILLGDALFSHAMNMATEFDRTDIYLEVGTALRDVCQGEIKQAKSRFNLELTEAAYYQIIEMKTGALFAAATRLPATFERVSQELIRALNDVGMILGTAYQIYDDCLDLVGDDKMAGKTLRTDLENGKLTLPLIHILNQASQPQRAEVLHHITKSNRLDLDLLAEIYPFDKAIDYAVDQGVEKLNIARNQLATLPKNRYQQALLEITDSMEGLLLRCLN